MEQNIILIVVSAIIIPVLGWLLLDHIQHKQKIIIISKGQDDMSAKLNSLVESFKRMDNKIDLFLKSELEALKDLSRASTKAIEKLADKK